MSRGELRATVLKAASLSKRVASHGLNRRERAIVRRKSESAVGALFGRSTSSPHNRKMLPRRPPKIRMGGKWARPGHHAGLRRVYHAAGMTPQLCTPAGIYEGISWFSGGFVEQES